MTNARRWVAPPSSLSPLFTTSVVPTPLSAHLPSFLLRQVGAQRCVGPHHLRPSPIYSPPLCRPPHLPGYPLCVPPLVARTPIPLPRPFHANGDTNGVVRTLLPLVCGLPRPASPCPHALPHLARPASPCPSCLALPTPPFRLRAVVPSTPAAQHPSCTPSTLFACTLGAGRRECPPSLPFARRPLR